MFGTRRLYIVNGRGIILPFILIVLIGASPLSAQQRAETRGNQSPSLIAGRDAIVNYGPAPEQLQELTKAAAAGAVGPLLDKIVDLSSRLGVTLDATLAMLRIIGQEDVPLDQLRQKLAEVANNYKKFEAQLAALNPQNPLARSLIEQAQAEIKAGNFIKAHQLLSQAKQAQIAAAQQARDLRQKAQLAEDEDFIQASASSAAEGDLAMTELHYLQAAELFNEAAGLVPPGSAYDDKRIGFLQREADALYAWLVGLLAREKSLAESYGAILAVVGKADIGRYVRGIQLYADAKAESDSLIAELKFCLTTGQDDPAQSAALTGALQKRVAFSSFVVREVIVAPGDHESDRQVQKLAAAFSGCHKLRLASYNDAYKEQHLSDLLSDLQWRSFAEIEGLSDAGHPRQTNLRDRPASENLHRSRRANRAGGAAGVRQ
jgi:hypothetical protein